LLPGRLLAGRWKIRREDLEAFIERAPPKRDEGERKASESGSAE
jgi:hypothetical protein